MYYIHPEIFPEIFCYTRIIIFNISYILKFNILYLIYYNIFLKKKKR